ncbi:MAG: MBL fold metallo-hydrolase [Tissierellia bacterium]|nr:MBL fold metallo-hydrolase [Tissierellia bacterium]
MGMKYCSLSSGSSGNCQYIETDSMKILVDGGLSGKRIEYLLSSIDVSIQDIDCILVTHEHIDHVKGVGVISRRYDIPILANEKTWLAMSKLIGNIDHKNIKIIETDKAFQLKDLGIYPFRIFHDAADPVGYCFYHKNIKMSIMTDTGWVNEQMKSIIKDSNLYVIESNHDLKMLKEGRYPWHLKKRILSNRGHLSNLDAGKVLSEVLRGNGETVLLAHLSKENNIPSLAYETVHRYMEECGLNVNKDIQLDLTYRDRATRVYAL